MQETPRVGWWQRLMQTSTAAKVGILAGAVVFSCALCACISVASLAALGGIWAPASKSTAPAHAVLSQATTAPAPTSTTASTTPTVTGGASSQSGVTVAALGGPVQAFYAKYGTEVDNLLEQ